MSILNLVNSVALWIAVALLVLFQVGTMRELAMMRIQRGSPPSVKDDGPEIGAHLPHILVSPINGRPESWLTEYRGSRGTLLAMLSPLCESCQDLVSVLNGMHRLYGHEVGIVAVLDADVGVGRSFLGMFPLTTPVILDHTGDVTKALGVVNKPSGLLYDAAGILRTKAVMIDEGILKEVLDDVIGEPDAQRLERDGVVSRA